MFSFLAPYKWFAIGAIIAGVIYGIYALFAHERDVGYQRCVAEYTTQQLLAEAKTRAKEAQLNKQVEDAQHAANIREQESKKLSAALTASDRKLRDTTTTLRNKLSTNSCETNRNTADAAITVFGECARKYTAMAENATGHANDVQRLEDMWPQ